jgi:uncharacterized membrane protein
MLHLAAPLWLLGALPLVLLVLWRLRSLPNAHVGARRRLIQASMGLAALCAALAIGRIEWGTQIDRVATVFVIDRSRSVEQSDRERGDGAEAAFRAVREASESMTRDDLAGVVVFGTDTATESLPQARPNLSQPTASIARDGTDIAAGLRRALADLPSDAAPRIVLISDGLETAGDALDAAQVAGSRGIPIDTLAVERRAQAEMAVERVIVPTTADADEPVEIRIVTRATRAGEARIRVRRDGVVIAETTTTIEAGTDALSLRDRTSEAGVHRYDVEIEPTDDAGDVSIENNVGGGFLRITGHSRALILTERIPEAEALATSLRTAGLDVSVSDARTAPLLLSEFASYDLIVLSDFNARSFTTSQMEALRSYVRDLGGGLLMAGARDSFGLGGYAYTPIEEVLPATFDLRRRRDRASLAMIIAIDKSGSMTVEVSPGVMKLDLANEGAARSAMLLSPTDRIGVMHVDTEVTWTVPMTAVEQPTAIANRIRHAEPGGGGIYVDVTLGASYQALRAETTQLKHLLLFSDGSDSEEMTHARDLVQQAARAGITTSVVSMGTGPDTPQLEQLSRVGGGRFYIVEDLTELPRIFTQETITASRSALIEESVRATLGNTSEITRGIEFGTAPPLSGFVIMNARPRASVLLGARRAQAREEGDDPLLLTWRAGVGQSACFSTDVGGNFGQSWLDWPGYTPLFGQLARSLVRAPERSDAMLDVRIAGSHGTIRVDAIDEGGRFRNHLDLLAIVSGPGGVSQQVQLDQRGPGRYEADFDGAAPGAYLVTVRELGEDGEGTLLGSAGVVRGRGDELRGDGTNNALLAQISAASGGRVLTSLAGLFNTRPPPITAYAPLWRAFLLASMLLLLASVALRRFVLPARLAALLARLTSRRPPAPTGQATLTVDALRARREARSEERPARPEASTEPTAAPSNGAPETASAPVETPKPAAPGTLAESLLERKRKKR